MPILHDDKIIFIHIPKTGGTTLEFALGIPSMVEQPPSICKRWLKGDDEQRVLTHLTAQQLLEFGYVTKRKFNDYFKFSFVRNPWDRVLSAYCWESVARNPWGEAADSSPQPAYPFDMDTLKTRFTYSVEGNNDDGNRRLQIGFITSGSGDTVVNYIGRFEDYDNSVAELEALIGRPLNTKTARNVSHRKRDYRAYYNDEMADFVRVTHAPDIAMFGYSF